MDTCTKGPTMEWGFLFRYLASVHYYSANPPREV